MSLDLEAIERRWDALVTLSERLDNGHLPSLTLVESAAMVGRAATDCAADVPELLDEIQRLETQLGRFDAQSWGDLIDERNALRAELDELADEFEKAQIEIEALRRGDPS